MFTLLSDVARMYPNYTDGSRISVDLSQTRMTRAEVLDVMMDFFWNGQNPEFTAISI
jgi:hypothetical protein